MSAEEALTAIATALAGIEDELNQCRNGIGSFGGGCTHPPRPESDLVDVRIVPNDSLGRDIVAVVPVDAPIAIFHEVLGDAYVAAWGYTVGGDVFPYIAVLDNHTPWIEWDALAWRWAA
jgi:hypothetical protein